MSKQKEEVRKIQVTGVSTYIVSLPKEWVNRAELKRGDPIQLIEQDDSTLLLAPMNILKEKTRIANINISSNDSPDSVIRKVVAFYLIGYNTIRLNVKERFTPEQRDILKDFVRRKLVGVEILTDSNNEMALQTLLNYSEFSVENALRRMTTITTSMHRDAMTALKENNQRLAQTIIKTDDEVDRFSFYIIRQLKYAVEDNRIIKEIGLRKPRDCLGYRVITKSVERAADHAVNIAKNILEIKTIDQALFTKIHEMSIFALSIFEDAVRSLFSNDYDAADNVLTREKIIETYDKDILRNITSTQFDLNTVASLRLIIESIRRLAEYGSDIAEVVLNLTAEEIVIQ